MPQGTRHGLPRAALDRLRDVLAPDGQVTRVRPLRGGISAKVHLVHMQEAGGARRAVVVRRYGEYWTKTDSAACGREFKTLDVLARLSFPAPRPLMLDVEGGPFGAPTVVMTRLPGRPELAPLDLRGYLRQLAHTLAQLHGLPTRELGFLPEQRDLVARVLSKAGLSDDPLQQAICEAAPHEWLRVGRSASPRVLVHGDYWPANVLWVRGRLVGIVDWEQPRLGDADQDVATCRADLWVLFGQAAAEDFVGEYERAADVKVDLRFWSLLAALWAVPGMVDWAVAYPVLGRPDLTAEVAVGRIRAFARDALARL